MFECLECQTNLTDVSRNSITMSTQSQGMSDNLALSQQQWCSTTSKQLLSTLNDEILKALRMKNTCEATGSIEIVTEMTMVDDMKIWLWNG